MTNDLSFRWSRNARFLLVPSIAAGTRHAPANGSNARSECNFDWGERTA